MEKIEDLSFNRSACLGRERFSSVFKGNIDAASVAVKRFLKDQTQVDSAIIMKLKGNNNIIQFHCVKRSDIEYV